MKFTKRKLALSAIDLLSFLASYSACMLFSYFPAGGADAPGILEFFGNFAILWICIFISRYVCRVYAVVWRYAGVGSFLMIVMADFFGGVIGLTISYFTGVLFVGGWRTVSIVAIHTICTLCIRFTYQIYYKLQNRTLGDRNANKIRVAIVGAGQIGTLLAEELLYGKNSHYVPVCFFDDSPDKYGSLVCGLKVYSPYDNVTDKITKLEIKEFFIAIPSLDGDRLDEIRRFYLATCCKVKIYEFPFTDGAASPTERRVVREFKIEDLLFRNSLKVIDSVTADFYRGRTVLVTGGGGSIGSELCRQIAKCQPKQLIIFDIYENNAYDIQQELKSKYGVSLDLCVEIGSVRDRARLNALFAAYRPEIVFHAAAHKHVPLMEHSNCEAIKNNCLGTYNTADMAEKYGVRKFILISTDKAVNPTNVMGASKRMCEMIVQSRGDSNTAFAAVRFGNVLGSNGSVIPLFKRQIAAGGPITITDKRIIRYFMTIPEASGLVMRAGAMAKSGELFVLDMGKPVKILDLAKNMISLSGLTPYEDIDIVETGLRPGEKLYEELLIKTETLKKTDNSLIFIEQDHPLTREEVDKKLDVLRAALEAAEDEIGATSITEAMKSVIPTFRSPDEVNRTAAESEEMKRVRQRA